MRECNTESPKQGRTRFNSQWRQHTLPIWVYNLSMDSGLGDRIDWLMLKSQRIKSRPSFLFISVSQFLCSRPPLITICLCLCIIRPQCVSIIWMSHAGCHHTPAIISPHTPPPPTTTPPPAHHPTHPLSLRFLISQVQILCLARNNFFYYSNKIS